MALVAQEDSKMLTGQLVEILGARNEVTKVQYKEPGTDKPSTTYERLSGKLGRCLAWRPEEDAYMVNTFDSSVAFVPAARLEVFTPDPPEKGGFDLAWPQVPGAPGELDLDIAGGEVAGHLADKGFCVIQMYNRPEELSEAFMTTVDMDEVAPSFLLGMESAFLGRDCSTKVASFNADTKSSELDAALNRINRGMTQVGMSVRPHTPVFLDFEAWGQTNPLLRFSTHSEKDADDESKLDLYKNNKNAMFSVEQSYNSFLETRRLCMLYCVTNEGGDLLLFPREQMHSHAEVRIPLESNRLVIFRNDMLGFSYEPLGLSLALQAWVTTGKTAPSTLAKPGVELVATGPMPRGKQAQVMSIDSRLPGNVWSADEQWLMQLTGTDTISKFPTTRWDCDEYYMDSDMAVQFGKSYTCHGGFAVIEALQQLDNDFFGITHEDALCMHPGQRMMLEVGYRILSFAGYTPEKLRGEPIGVYVGDVGVDWHDGDMYCLYNDSHAGDMDSIYKAYLGTHCAVTCSRLSYMYDLGGPVFSSDTACSASLVGIHQAHATMMENGVGRRQDSHAMMDRALCMGVNVLISPRPFVGNCAGNMLSHIGRCFTFDRTADGYCRGEGCNGLYTQFTDRAELVNERLACLAGTASNQDGRSATLTAPNGTSQQKCIRMSLTMAGLDPTHINGAECHGTGTALGDPIEVGALQATMRDGRTFPILHSSSKTNVGHLEAGAGSTGVLKCVLICMACVGPPNCHLNILNPHLEVSGYPVIFDTEASDEGHNTTFCGVSSFGFGGANARGDVFASCRRGPRSVHDIPDLTTPMQERSLAACPARELGSVNWRERHELDMHAPLPDIAIIGSWTGWSQPELMERVNKGTDATYVAHIRLGGSRFELFQLMVNGDSSQSFFPDTVSADYMAEMHGPGENPQNYAWVIDREDDAVDASTVYRITLIYSQRLVMWDALPESAAQNVRVFGTSFEHKYYLAGTFNNWTFTQMDPVDVPLDSSAAIATFDKPKLKHFTTEVTLGSTGVVEFQFIRDQDWDQCLYPSTYSDGPTPDNVPLVGLDPFGDGLNWHVEGEPGSQLRIDLIVDAVNGVFTVRADGKEWTSSSSAQRSHVKPTYWITTGDEFYRRLIPAGPPQQFKARLSMEDLYEVEFWIELNAGKTKEIFSPSEGVIAKTEESLSDSYWTLEGRPGQIFEITLDLNKDDASKAVTWKSLRLLR